MTWSTIDLASPPARVGKASSEAVIKPGETKISFKRSQVKLELASGEVRIIFRRSYKLALYGALN